MDENALSDTIVVPRIREATASDLEVILQHRRCMFADMGEGTESQLEAMVGAARSFLEAALEDGTYRGWLVELGSRVVAGGGLAIIGFQPTPFDPRPRRAWVVNVYTEPAFRRQGLARRLLETMLAWCHDQGFKALFLHASDSGRPLYESLGFVPTNEMKRVLDERG